MARSAHAAAGTSPAVLLRSRADTGLGTGLGAPPRLPSPTLRSSILGRKSLALDLQIRRRLRKKKLMGKGEIVAVLQIGGEFTTDAEGHMSYSGGEAHAMLVKSDWTFSAFKQEISSTLNNLKVDQFAFKYFLPKNDKTLISISNDKDLRRMVEFHAESATTYIYVMKKVDNR
ncbi:hypothetical protein EJB05_41630, partial [Eragrostis curvula]